MTRLRLLSFGNARRGLHYQHVLVQNVFVQNVFAQNVFVQNVYAQNVFAQNGFAQNGFEPILFFQIPPPSPKDCRFGSCLS